MKLSLYIENGFSQIVLTPESEMEKAICKTLATGEIEVHRGEFFHCQGGWLREGSGSNSVMISMKDKTP